MGSSTDLIVQVIEYVPQHDKRQMVLDLLQTLEKVGVAYLLCSVNVGAAPGEWQVVLVLVTLARVRQLSTHLGHAGRAMGLGGSTCCVGASPQCPLSATLDTCPNLPPKQDPHLCGDQRLR